jgi:hypothetical protein
MRFLPSQVNHYCGYHPKADKSLQLLAVFALRRRPPKSMSVLCDINTDSLLSIGATNAHNDCSVPGDIGACS